MHSITEVQSPAKRLQVGGNVRIGPHELRIVQFKAQRGGGRIQYGLMSCSTWLFFSDSLRCRAYGGFTMAYHEL